MRSFECQISDIDNKGKDFLPKKKKKNLFLHEFPLVIHHSSFIIHHCVFVCLRERLHIYMALKMAKSLQSRRTVFSKAEHSGRQHGTQNRLKRFKIRWFSVGNFLPLKATGISKALPNTDPVTVNLCRHIDPDSLQITFE